MKIPVYILYGKWNGLDIDIVKIIGVSADEELLLRRLNEIADSKASEYVEMNGYILETQNERYYEIAKSGGKYARFYITEHQLRLSEDIMGAVSREMERIDRTRDIEQYLRDLYEEGNIPAWLYEYMTREPAVMQEILQIFSKTEDCNTPFNTTMDIAVGNVMKEIVFDDKKLEFLWEEFGDVLIDDDECILDDFLGFECGTHREEVWHWFDERYSGGVAGLMFGTSDGGTD